MKFSSVTSEFISIGGDSGSFDRNRRKQKKYRYVVGMKGASCLIQTNNIRLIQLGVTKRKSATEDWGTGIGVVVVKNLFELFLLLTNHCVTKQVLNKVKLWCEWGLTLSTQTSLFENFSPHH